MPFSWGRFGENLTTEGPREGTLCIGDRLRIGSAVLMVTQPRMPCYKLDLRFDREGMIKRFLMSGWKRVLLFGDRARGGQCLRTRGQASRTIAACG